MVEKRCVVAAGTERADAEIGAGARVLALFRTPFYKTSSVAALPHRDILFRISNVAGHGVHKFLQRVRAFHGKKAASIAVRIDVKSGMLLEFVAMILSPLRGAQQHGLFTVPRAIDDRALRLPSLLEQLAQGARFFQ